MLYIDGISLSKIKEELKNELLTKRINRIFKNNELSLSFHFGKIELLFSCIPTLPICYITQNKEQPILDVASSFISNLRKYLMNASLVNIEQLGFDRILVFHFSKINELGKIKKYKVYFECFGNLSNIIFTDADNIIIDSLKKFNLSENVDRTLFLGEEYRRANYEKKYSPLEINENIFNELFYEKKFLNIEGVGKVLANSILSFENFKNIITGKINPKIYFRDKKIKLATILDIDYKDYDDIKTFDSYKDMINFYIDYEYKATSFMLLKNRLNSVIEKKLKKIDKTMLMIKNDINDSKDMEKIKQEGDILASVLYNVKKGMPSVRAYDFYNNKEINIELDSLISPNENLNKIYKKCNKVKRSLANALRREQEVNDEKKYLESTLLFITNSSDVATLREIEEELIKYKYISAQHKTKKNKINKIIKYGSIEKDDYIIFYGRNNIENDNLTFKVSSKNDYWFHVKDIPSSHIIVKCSNLTEDIIIKAAQLTAYFSKYNLGDKVAVDYTMRKNVAKPNGAKPGFVIYTNQKTIVVEKINIEKLL